MNYWVLKYLLFHNDVNVNIIDFQNGTMAANVTRYSWHVTYEGTVTYTPPPTTLRTHFLLIGKTKYALEATTQECIDALKQMTKR